MEGGREGEEGRERERGERGGVRERTLALCVINCEALN